MPTFSFVPTDSAGPGASFGPPPGDAGASRVPLLVGVTVLCMAIITVVTSLRLYTRHVILRTTGLDDAFAVLAWVSGGPLAPIGGAAAG